MSSRIYPSWNEILSFRPPLTEGELTLAKFLDKTLPPTWEIYPQPLLNGDKPDLVILNPSVGMVIFEVKDCNLQSCHNQKKYKSQNPIKQVERYRENLVNLYLPQIGDAIDLNSKNLSAFKVGLYFHNLTTNQAKEFISSSEKKCVIFGRDLLHAESIAKIVLDVNRSSSLSMSKDWAREIRFWLKPPFHSLEQGQLLKLTAEQKRHTQPSPNQHQRLRGVAGSGKTLVIAQRAANLASQGKKILIVTFNITLWHYIRDHISRARFSFNWDRLEFWHFHGFCSNFLRENNVPWPSDVEGEVLFNQVVPELVLQTVRSGKNKKRRRYDAILVDEGQDFQKSYYEVLCAFLSENDELLFVADERQNIFKRELSWIHAMEGTRFRGRWRELKECYRLPAPMLEQVNRFAKMFLPDIGLVPVPQVEQRELFNPHLKWKDVYSFEEAKNSTIEMINYLTRTQNVHPQDIVILVSTHSEGWSLVKTIERQGIKVNHVFEDANRSHQHKQAFWMNDGRLKMSTIHSFKGWEVLNVIIITPPDEDRVEENFDALLYVAITRSRQNLIVFNQNSKYRDYGKSWSNRWFIDNKFKINFDDIPF